MNDSEVLDVLQDIWWLEASAFTRYVVEVSQPPVEDDVDRRALATFQDVYRDLDRNLQAVSELLGARGEEPGMPGWPLSYTTFNYLRPRYLLRLVCDRQREQLQKLESFAERLEGCGDSEVTEVVETLVRRERRAVEKLEQALEETPEAEVVPAKRKGTSASRW